MSRRRIILLSGAGLAAGLLVACGWWLFIPRPSLAEAAALAEARQFDEAEAIVAKVLYYDPSRSDAHMLAAQILLNRPAPPSKDGLPPDRKPAVEALEHLAKVQTSDPYLSALLALNRGKAEYRLGRLDDAETHWLETLQIDPTFPEAGWFLLETYYLQGRSEDARRLAVRLHKVETDPHDRVQYLLEIVRQDAQPTAPASIVPIFDHIIAQSPNELHANLALGTAQIHAGQIDKGLETLQKTVKAHSEQTEAWDAWLTGLDNAGQVELLGKVLERLPRAIAESNSLIKHRGRVAQERGDWKAVADLYRRALVIEPHDNRLVYRLARALRNAGNLAEADALDRQHQESTSALQEVRALYEIANADKTLGTKPRPDLYRLLAENRKRMGLAEEAAAWSALALAHP